ncbi:MAG TPA: C4-type zinc ribbon domain-containing protein [Acidimicrobiales bacterium]|nr:C4-type zinc ribbon domain-containing protein [Acidimicrobiales bacterium]
MNPWKQLLDVQTLDTSLTQLDHRELQLPARTELTEVEGQLAALRAEVAAVEGDKHVLDKEQKRIEDEIASIEDKIASADRQLYSGSSDVKELQALQDEIAALKRRISALEDQELELMEQVEPIDARLAGFAARQAELDEQAVALTTAIAEAEADIDRERNEVRSRRDEVVAEIDPTALQEYETVRGRLGGVAVARLEHGSCGACHMKLSAVENDRILHLSPDEPVRCEDCGRFLVRD